MKNYRERPRFSNTTFQYLKSGIVRQYSSGLEAAKYPVYRGKIGLNYNVSSHNLGFYYDFSFKPSSSTGRSLTNRYTDHVFSETLENLYDINRHNRQQLFSAYYTGEVGKLRLSANFDALWQINDRHTAENEITTMSPDRDFTTVNDVKNRLLAGNLIASLPVWKGDFRFGTEISNIHRTDVYSGNAEFIRHNDIKISRNHHGFICRGRADFWACFSKCGITLGTH